MEAIRKWSVSSQIRGAINNYACDFTDDINIVRALILQGLRSKYENNPMGIIIEFLRPIAVCAAHYFYFTMTGRPVPGHQYVIFTIGGFSEYFCFSAAYFATYDGGRRKGGIPQIPGVTRMHFRVAGAGWAFLLHLGFAFVVVVPLLLINHPISFPNIPLSIATYGLASGLGFGYGLVCNGIVSVVPFTAPFIKILQWAVFITSGVYDSLVTMPFVMAHYIQYNPLMHIAEYQRYAFYSGYPIYLVTLTYPLTWAVGLILTGLIMNRALCNRKFR